MTFAEPQLQRLLVEFGDKMGDFCGDERILAENRCLNVAWVLGVNSAKALLEERRCLCFLYSPILGTNGWTCTSLRVLLMLSFWRHSGYGNTITSGLIWPLEAYLRGGYSM